MHFAQHLLPDRQRLAHERFSLRVLAGAAVEFAQVDQACGVIGILTAKNPRSGRATALGQARGFLELALGVELEQLRLLLVGLAQLLPLLRAEAGQPPAFSQGQSRIGRLPMLRPEHACVDVEHLLEAFFGLREILALQFPLAEQPSADGQPFVGAVKKLALDGDDLLGIFDGFGQLPFGPQLLRFGPKPILLANLFLNDSRRQRASRLSCRRRLLRSGSLLFACTYACRAKGSNRKRGR